MFRLLHSSLTNEIYVKYNVERFDIYTVFMREFISQYIILYDDRTIIMKLQFL